MRAMALLDSARIFICATTPATTAGAKVASSGGTFVITPFTCWLSTHASEAKSNGSPPKDADASLIPAPLPATPDVTHDPPVGWPFDVVRTSDACQMDPSPPNRLKFVAAA